MKKLIQHIVHTLSRTAFMNLGPVLFICLLAGTARGQEVTPDELFRQARVAAFERKDHQAAKDLCKKALAMDPGYADIQIFLARLYTWTDQPDSARSILKAVLDKDLGNEDASLAYGSLEYWNHQPDRALAIVGTGLRHTPRSPGLLLLKAKILNDQRRFREASQAAGEALASDPKNPEARALASRIKDDAAGNTVGVGYEFAHFDKQFADPWHLISIDYSRQTGLGTVTARTNYARRFASNGLQFELEAYPRISKTFYAYAAAGYSADSRIFPEYRAGFSLFAILPRSFEAEAGFRLLHFTDNTMVYTFSAGKYYSDYWFNLRAYLVPSGHNISQSYALTGRYYYGGPDDFLSLTAGTGISPDDNSNNILLSGDYKLKANTISIGFRRAIRNRDVLILGASWQHQEYSRHTWGNQVGLSAGYQRRF